MVRHRGDVRIRFVDRVQNLVLEEFVDEFVNSVVERGTEEHALSASRCCRQDPRHNRQESEVRHVVGLIEDSHFDSTEVHEALLHQVFEATGGGNDDVDAFLERRNLTVLRDATKDGH